MSVHGCTGNPCIICGRDKFEQTDRSIWNSMISTNKDELQRVVDNSIEKYIKDHPEEVYTLNVEDIYIIK